MLEKLIPLWSSNPVLFVEQVFGIDSQASWRAKGSDPRAERIEAWQEDALMSLVLERRIAIKSGKGVGKSTFLAWALLWFISTRREVKIPCTAPSSHQLFDVLWAECRKWVSRMKPEVKIYLPIVVKTDYVEIDGMGGINFAVARTARRETPEALQGFHAANVLLIVDEASGVHEEIFKAGEGTMSGEGAITLLTGNPTRLSGYFFDSFNKDRARWKCFTVRCQDSYLVTEDYIEGMKHKYGEDSNEFRVGVLGEFPLGEGNSIIPLYLVQGAVGRDAQDRRPVVWGLDVSRGTGDFNALAKRRGRVLLEQIMTWRSPDTMHTAGIVVDEYYRTPDDLKPVEIIVDVIGVGGPVYDRLKELGLPVRPCNVATKSSDKNYPKLRDELWFKARAWFDEMDCSIPDDGEFIAELSSVQYKFTSDGRRELLDKEAIGHSPDRADAFILTMASWKDRAIEQRNSSLERVCYAEIDASYADGGIHDIG